MALLIVALAAGWTGCNQPESGTRNIVDVVSLNGNQPLLSDVYSFGQNVDDPIDDFIPVDIVEVVLKARPNDGVVTLDPNRPFGSVRFIRYTLVWEGDNADGADLDGDGVVDLPNFESPMNVLVPANGVASGFVTIVSAGSKVQVPVSCLGPISDPDCREFIYNPPCGRCLSVDEAEYNVNATVTFIGQEETSGQEIQVTRGLQVSIGQFADEN
jgi:hypothetical protein